MSLVERRYAEALINIAGEHDALDSYQQDLKAFANLYSGEFKDFLLNPQNEINEKKNVVKNAFSDRINDDVVNFILFLMDKGRIKFLPGIYDEFSKLADEKRSVLNIGIISATPLDDSQIKLLTGKYAKMYSAASVKAQVEVDASLIGGVKVVIGDKMVDASVKGRLRDLQRLLMK